MVATENATLTKLKSGRLALGLIVKLHSGVEMPKIAKACDHDFLFIDMQQGEMSVEAVVALCHASLNTGVTRLVRVPVGEASTAMRGLDNGAMGIIAPNVETADDARLFVKNRRFAPLGTRSVSAGYPQLEYGSYGPGVELSHYLEDGVRLHIEDMYVISTNGIEVLTRDCPRDLTIPM